MPSSTQVGFSRSGNPSGACITLYTELTQVHMIAWHLRGFSLRLTAGILFVYSLTTQLISISKALTLLLFPDAVQERSFRWSAPGRRLCMTVPQENSSKETTTGYSTLGATTL